MVVFQKGSGVMGPQEAQQLPPLLATPVAQREGGAAALSLTLPAELSGHRLIL